MTWVLTFLLVTVPRTWREWRWRRAQTAVSDSWMRERKGQRALPTLTED